MSNNTEIKYSDLKIGQRVWFNANNDEFPMYVSVIIDKIFPSNKFDDGYIHGITDDGTCEKYKIYFKEIIIEEPEKKYQMAAENDLDNNSEILHITKSKFNELLKGAIKENIRISTQITINEDGFIETYTDIYFDNELLVNTKNETK